MDDPWLRKKGSSPVSLTWPGMSPPTDPDAELVSAVRDVFAVRSVRRTSPSDGRPAAGLFARRAGQDEARPLGGFFSRQTPALEIRGQFLVDSREAYERVAPRFRDLGHVTLFRQSGDDKVIYAVPGELPSNRTRVWLAVLLFIATALSVLYVGAVNGSGATGQLDILAAVPYAVSLLAILGAHEAGHYLMARVKGVPSSLPFFIPMPLPESLIGTMGAVMQMKAPPKNKGALLAVGAAGPIAGLLVAIPVLIIGLSMSPVQLSQGSFIQEGNSLLYAALKYLVKGQFLPSGGFDVMLNPVAWAGWTGLLITSLNLIPAGQLDGGHMAYVLLGRRARYLTWPIIAVLVTLGLTLWLGWLLWAAMVFFFGQIHATPLDDVTPITRGERAIAAFALIVFVLVFMPAPLSIVIGG